MKVGPLWLKLQIARGEQPAMGPGKAELLEAIAEHGSISGAGRAMGMSYRRAWVLVDEMNRSFVERLVLAAPGGGPKGGAKLTEMGRTLLRAFREMEREAGRVVDHAAYHALVDALRPAEDGPPPSID